MSSPGCSFSITARQPLMLAGLTHASSVMPEVRSREGLSPIVTQLLVPLNESALPAWPAAHVAFAIVPLFPLPDASATMEPVPSSNEYAATRPVVEAEALPASTEVTGPAAFVERIAAASSAASAKRRQGRIAGIRPSFEVESTRRLGHR